MPTVSFTTAGALRKSALRQANERLVLDSIRRNPGISRAEIARTTGFSRTSVTFVVNRMIKDRLISEEKIESGPSAGRPPTALRLRTEALIAVAVEISAPETRVALFDWSGAILATRTVMWQPKPEFFIDDVHTAIRALAGSRKQQRMLGVGISLPGTIDKASGRVIAAEGLGWLNVEVGNLLGARTRLPLFFENDANLSALAEQWYAPVTEEALRYFVYVRTRDGVGTGVVMDGRILHGAASAGSEFGHVMLFPDGRPCRCGNRGCWEQYASDAALVRAYKELGGETGGTDRIPEDALMVVKLAREGNGAAMRALQATALYLALGFANLVAAVNPQAIILGEPFASAWDLIEDLVLTELRGRSPAYSIEGLRILPSRIGMDSALRGAAALVLAHFFTRFDHTKDDSLPIKVSMDAYG
jgi:predicted NBD/HSP70 family sugar kinase